MNANLTNYLRMLSQFSHDVQMYLLVSGLIGLSYIGFLSVLLNLYLLRLGYGPEFIGLVNGSTAVAYAVSSLPAGALGGRYGSRRVVIVGVTLVGLGIALLPVAELLNRTWQGPVIIVTRLLSGLGFALYSVNANPMLMALATPQEREHVFSVRVALPPLTGFAGSLVAGVLPGMIATNLGVTLDDPAPYRLPMYIGGALFLPAVWALMKTADVDPKQTTAIEQEANPEPTQRKFSSTTLATPYLLITLLAITTMLRVSGEGAARSFFNIYLDTELGVSTAQIGLLTAVGQILAAPIALVTPWIVSRCGKVPAVVISTIGIAASMLVMALIPHWLGAGLGFMGVIGMLSIARVVTYVYQMEVVTSEWRAAMSGGTSMAMGLGYSCMTLGGGYLIIAIGYQGLFLTGTVMVLISAILFWAYFRVPRGEYAKQEVEVIES